MSLTLTACGHCFPTLLILKKINVQGFLGPVITVKGNCHTAREMYDSLHLGCQAVPDCLRIQDEIMSTPVVNGDIAKFIQCQEALDFPGAIPSCKMFDAFAQQLVQVDDLQWSSSYPTNGNHHQQPSGGGKTCQGYQGTGGANGGRNSQSAGDPKQNNGTGTTNNPTLNTNTNQHTNTSNSHPTAMVTTSTVPDVLLATSSAQLGALNGVQWMSPQLMQETSLLVHLGRATSSHQYCIIRPKVPGFHALCSLNPVMCYDFQNDKVPRDCVTVMGTLGHNYTVEGMDKFLVLELFDCLHAPDALVNLILTGTLLEKKFSLYMTEDVVRVYIPNTPQFLIVVDVYHRLCLLRGEFLSDKVEALSDLLPSVMATFMPRIPNGDLFHECLLHIGKQTVNEVLTGNYANGLDKWNGTCMKDMCGSCL
ncbi:hypothetical protein BT96DRAFT_945200 [Gymnopus androsaceus JB14]|uniref:Uncharacterized protein n=1 Tax=Gymnopus androsaceus JB14 TaxID=1447944 RepID=A0A6A4H1R6_9AGAR|nr:hypothetical protein BT96DRAFT_945200 [Gymnopus androsaceus JB14]